MFKRLFIMFASVALLASCSDRIYEDINTDPTKPSKVNAAAQLTYAELQFFGDMNYVDVHRLYTYAFTQHLMGCWNTTNYGGQHRKDDNEMLRPWNNLYAGAVRNLTDAIEQTKEDPAKANLNAALRIMRVYTIGVLTDFYGDVPDTEAGLGFISGEFHPKFDEQKDIYYRAFEELRKCIALFNPAAEKISSDPLFGGDTELWKQFANSLCLRYAMRLQKVDEDKAKEEFATAWANATLTEDAVVKHMNVSYSFGQEAYSDIRGNALSKFFYGNDPANNPSYICYTLWEQLYTTGDPRLNMLCRFYIDDYQNISTGDGRYDITEAMMAQEAAKEGSIGRNLAGNFSWDEWPSVPSPLCPELQAELDKIVAAHPDYDNSANPRWTMPKLAINYLRSDNPGVLMTQAEVCFLGAEASVRGWISDDARDLYETGIREAIDFEVKHYGSAAPKAGAVDAYLTKEGIAFGSAADHRLLQINTQAWIHHFHNPAECWANLRRADLPKLKTPKEWGCKNPMINGDEIPVRLEYPVKEQNFNGANYSEAVGRVEGTYNWNAPVWWDK